jgi:hypothetical protein
LREIYKVLTPYLGKVCLVSAFDIAKGHISQDELYSSDTLFVDSGGYEVKPLNDPLEAYQGQAARGDWPQDAYKRVLSELKPNSEIVVVSYDGADYLTLQDQLDSAVNLFSAYPSFAGDFLWKPEPGSDFCGDPEYLVARLGESNVVRCVGVTDKELGASVVDRCRSIATLRTCLQRSGMDLPIHVLGCLDPLNCALFFLCGADVFDGLSWLRYAYIGNAATYMQQAPLIAAGAELRDEDVAFSCWVANLDVLGRVQRSLEEFGAHPDARSLLLSQAERQSLSTVLRKAGISTEGVI